MGWIRRCEACGRTFSTMDGDDSTLCPDCSGVADYRESWTSGRIMLLAFTIAKSCALWFIRLMFSLVKFIFNHLFWIFLFLILVGTIVK